MNSRKVGGLILIFCGILLVLIFSILKINLLLVSLIYLLPIIIIGFVMFFNEGEDKIEQINYSKMKKGVKK